MASTVATKDGYTRVRLAEVVENASDSAVPPPDAAAKYIGLEHLDSASFIIRRWGSDIPLEVPKTYIKAGDVLFARRNTHLRRCAIAPFDTFFSPDGYALRSKSPALLQEYLLCVVASDSFMEFAIRHSAGTHSKRVRWTQLAQYEIDLPPLDEQRSVANAFIALSTANDSATQVADAAVRLVDATSHALFSEEGTLRRDWPIVRVADVCQRVSVGIVIQPAQLYVPQGIRCFRSANVRRGYVQDDDWVFIAPSSHQAHRKSELSAGDVLVVRTGANVGMSCVVPDAFAGANCIDIVFASPLREMLVPGWLELFINSSVGRAQILRDGQGLAQKHFGVSALNDMRIPLPPVGTQTKYVQLVETCRAAARAAVTRAATRPALLRLLHKS